MVWYRVSCLVLFVVCCLLQFDRACACKLVLI
jgi:hypothetical protein